MGVRRSVEGSSHKKGQPLNKPLKHGTIHALRQSRYVPCLSGLYVRRTRRTKPRFPRNDPAGTSGIHKDRPSDRMSIDTNDAPTEGAGANAAIALLLSPCEPSQRLVWARLMKARSSSWLSSTELTMMAT